MEVTGIKNESNSNLDTIFHKYGQLQHFNKNSYQKGEVMPFSEVVKEKGNQKGEVMPFSEVVKEKGNQKGEVVLFQSE